MQQLLLDIKLPACPMLDNFLPGRNAELVQILIGLVSDQGRERFVYMWGDLGCGKSHLLHAMVNAYSQKGLKSTYFSGQTQPEFLLDNTIDCVAIDDVDQLDAAAQIRLFNLYNQLRDERHAVFLASGPVAPAQLSMRQDLVTRLGWGLVYQVHELTEEEKMQALKRYAEENGFNLPQEICHYLLRHSQRDLLSLISTLDALDRYSLAHKRRITIPLLKELLQGAS